MAAMLGGCAIYTQTHFSEWRGNSVFTGTGGTANTVDGIDIWTNGSPNHKCQILGIIDQSQYQNGSPMAMIASMNARSDVIQKAKQVGGDAIMYIGSTQQLMGLVSRDVYGAYNPTVATTAKISEKSRIVVLKYLD